MVFPTILIIKTGSTYRELKKISGDFDFWFKQKVNNPEVKWRVKQLKQVDPARLESYQGIIIMGAHESLTRGYLWLDGMRRIRDRIIDREIPTLGVCFGHQLINRVLGGEVITNPLGLEIGVTKIQLTVDGLVDPLFHNLNAGKVEVYSCHSDIVSQIGEGVVTLAWNAHSRVQATRYGKNMYAVQFHPEFDKAIMDFYIKRNWDYLQKEHDLNPIYSLPPEKLLSRNKRISSGKVLLGNFVGIVKESGHI